MYLEYITIHGFKSFANKTILDFRPAYKKGRVGITAIVGPNGSGKSNIVDAIRWGLGEQSSKNLRGKKSEDVIFAGSDQKARNSRAEVSLRLNNEDKKIDLDYSEIELTRQLFRNGDSAYFINRQKARLQDVHYLLAQANIGQKSYTVIGQGMIDKVLNSTPQQRKEFFDEAAGIKQYQLKKEQALHKLRSAKENLQQGEIQLQEITPRLKSLARQMKRWEQREQIMSNLKEKLDIYYSQRWKRINSNLKNLLEEKLKLETSKENKQKELTKLQTEMQKLAEISEENPDNFSNLEKEYTQKLQEKNQLTQKLAEWQGRQTNEWLKNGQADIALYQKQIDSLTKKIKENQKELTNIYEKIKTTKNNLSQKEKQQKSLLEEIKNIKHRLFYELNPDKEKFSHLTENNKKINNYLDELEQIFLQIINKPEKREELQSKFSELINKIKNYLRKSFQQTGRAKLAEWQEKLASLEEKKYSLEQNVFNDKAQIKYLEEKAASLAGIISKQQEEKKQLEISISQKQPENISNDNEFLANIEQLGNEISKLDKDLETIRQKLSTYNQNEENKKREIFNKQQQALEIQKQINKLQQNLTDCEIKLARWQTKRDELKHLASQDFSDSWENLTKRWSKQTEIEIDLAKLETEIQQLKNKKELIGSIDEETINEYKEINERHAWLEQQTSDLRQAVASLEKIITDLDNKIRDQFSSNIKLINKKFSHYFSILFNGGKAELKIKKEDIATETESEEENQNEENKEIKTTQSVISGIEIMATPPGKRLQSISMLSGGEKALTSIALICAIIANNSSPFVVLDEVDAALDEANSLRFAEILQELSDKTQFIVVTHNRATMEKAQLLYGVTMGADGVSKLLSIKLEEGKKYTNR